MDSLAKILGKTIALDCYTLCAEKIDGIFMAQSRAMWIASQVKKQIILDDGNLLYRFGTAIEIRSRILRHSGPSGWDRKKGVEQIILITNNRRCSNANRIKAMA